MRPRTATHARFRAALAVALAALLVSAAGCTALAPGGDGPTAPAATESVPGTADAVVHVDVAGYRSDEVLRELRETNVSADDDPLPGAPGAGAGAPTDDNVSAAAVSALANASAVNVSALQAVTVFLRYPDAVESGAAPDGVADAPEEAYVAALVTADWTTTDLVTSIENASRTGERVDDDGGDGNGEDAAPGVDSEPVDLVETTHAGHALYVPADDTRSGALGVLGEGRFVLGSRAAVEDAIDVAEGSLAPLNGSLRAAYGATREDAYLRAAATVPREALPASAFETDSPYNTEVFTNVTALSLAHYTREDAVGMQVGLQFTGAEVADDARSVVHGVQSTYRGVIANETAKTALSEEHLTVTRNGATVTVTGEYPVAFLQRVTRLLARYDSEPTGTLSAAAPRTAGVFKPKVPSPTR